jgi:ABC-type transport system involved in multi-copper enzyme maturation permease subunit
MFFNSQPAVFLPIVLYCIVFLIKPKAVKTYFNSSKLLFLPVGIGVFVFIGFSTFLDYYTGIQIENKNEKSGNFGSG